MFGSRISFIEVDDSASAAGRQVRRHRHTVMRIRPRTGPPVLGEMVQERHRVLQVHSEGVAAVQGFRSEIRQRRREYF